MPAVEAEHTEARRRRTIHVRGEKIMAPLPHNNTNIFYLDYTTCTRQHTLQVRFGTGTLAQVMADTDNFLDALGNSHRLMSINGARLQNEHTNVTEDVTWSGESSYGTGAGLANESAQYYDFIGRSAFGRRVRISVFGAIRNSANGVYRATPADDAAFGAALAVLRGEGTSFLAVDGHHAIWKNYVNLGDNAYWRNHIR